MRRLRARTALSLALLCLYALSSFAIVANAEVDRHHAYRPIAGREVSSGQVHHIEDGIPFEATAFGAIGSDLGDTVAQIPGGCTPRPRVTVATSVDNGRLRVEIGSTTSPTVPTNFLRIVRLGAPPNSQVVLASQSVVATAFDVPMPPQTSTYVLHVQRTAAGNITIPLTIVDDCGDWRTFVGAGPSLLTLVPPTPPPAATFEGVPICTDHDPTRWHPLVKRNTAGEITCTYLHEHHDDPRTVDDIFGPAGVWYGAPGQEISYAWQTHNAAGVAENAGKHEGYKWLVRRDLPCILVQGRPGCIVSYRTQVHVRGDVSDQTTRFHSFLVEAVVQDPQGRRGIVRHGGHIDTGFLGLLVDGGSALVCPPIPQNPPSFTCPTNTSGNFRSSSSKNVPAPHAEHTSLMEAWYGVHLVTAVSPLLEEWGPIDFTNPTAQLFHPAGARANNSRGRVEALFVMLTHVRNWAGADNMITRSGYTDVTGRPIEGCPAPSVACVPIKIEQAAAIDYGLVADTAPVLRETRDYDVTSPTTGQSLIRFPN